MAVNGFWRVTIAFAMLVSVRGKQSQNRQEEDRGEQARLTSNVDREREGGLRDQVLVVSWDDRVELNRREGLLEGRDRSRVAVTLDDGRRVDVLDVVLEEKLSCSLCVASARLIVDSGGDVVLSWREDEVCNIGSSDALRLEIEPERDVSGSDRNVRRVVEVSVDVDLEVVRVSVVDVEVGNRRRTSIETLETEEGGRDRERDVLKVERSNSGTGDGCRRYASVSKLETRNTKEGSLLSAAPCRVNVFD